MNKLQVIKAVQREILDSKGTRIWDDYVNALKLIAQVVFTRSSGFILELLQNAEDAGLDLQDPGLFRVRLNHQSATISHNGHPFSEVDVKALCGIHSSKKPEKGTLGYLGIGFKSVFKVTDCPEVHSGGFHFKFDRSQWSDPGNTPWHVLPLPTEPQPEASNEETVIILPFREKGIYEALIPEVERLSTELYLLLHWLKTIEVIDEPQNRRWLLENRGEGENGVTTLVRDGTLQQFKFFRSEVVVPDAVKNDRLTQEYRANVEKREIAIAFALDTQGRLAPQQAAGMYGGVYSFMPLAESRSGAKFPIQADFLVHPGRDAINHEAAWNQWLLDEVVKLCTHEVVSSLKAHSIWRYQILDAFGFTPQNTEAHQRFFVPGLHKPISAFLEDDECVPTSDNHWARPSSVVRLQESPDAIADLDKDLLLGGQELASAMSGQQQAEVAHPQVLTQSVREVDRQGLLENTPFLESKAQSPDAPSWFRKLYLWLDKHPKWVGGKRASRLTYHSHELVMTAGLKLLRGGDVSLVDISANDADLLEAAKVQQQSSSIVHPDILAGATAEERTRLRSFLTGFTGVQLWDVARAAKEKLLPQILVSAEKPAQADLLRLTRCVKNVLGSNLDRGAEIWVSTKGSTITRAREVLFPKEFLPEEDWETSQQYVPGLTFLDTAYLEVSVDADGIRAWRQFFQAAGVKERPDNGVEIFAVRLALERLQQRFPNLYPVDKLNLGYDIEALVPDGRKVCVEVKGLSKDEDVELTENETEAADTHKDDYFLYVVSGIPASPVAHLMSNPVSLGKKSRVIVPVATWKGHRQA